MRTKNHKGFLWTYMPNINSKTHPISFSQIYLEIAPSNSGVFFLSKEHITVRKPVRFNREKSIVFAVVFCMLISMLVKLKCGPPTSEAKCMDRIARVCRRIRIRKCRKLARKRFFSRPCYNVNHGIETKEGFTWSSFHIPLTWLMDTHIQELLICCIKSIATTINQIQLEAVPCPSSKSKFTMQMHNIHLGK